MNSYLLDNAHKLAAQRFGDNQNEINSELLEELEACLKDENAFDVNKFQKFPGEVILDYLYNTHHFYINYRLPGIQQSINLMLFHEEELDKDLMMMKIFFEAYQSNLNYHIKEEEEKFFPLFEEVQFTENLYYDALRSRIEEVFNQFLNEHTDEESILERMLNLVYNYKPSPQNASLFNRLCSQLEFFLKDLKIHARIEEEILFPSFIKKIEKIKPST